MLLFIIITLIINKFHFFITIIYMPLIVEDAIIPKISGPVNGVFMKPLEQLNINNIFFMMFSDIHSSKNYEQCADDDTTCTDFQPTFLKIMNDFASRFRVDFYIEPAKFNIVYKKATSDKEIKRLLSDDEKNIVKSTSAFNKYQSNVKSNPLHNGTKSNMQYVYDLNKICVGKSPNRDSLCKYKNILWHNANVRDMLEHYESKRQILDINDFFILSAALYEFLRIIQYAYVDKIFNESLNSDSTKAFIDDIQDNLSLSDFGKFNINKELFINILNYYNVVVVNKNYSVFVTQLFKSPLFSKQLLKMNENSKQIFNVDSFVELLNYYDTDINPNAVGEPLYTAITSQPHIDLTIQFLTLFCEYDLVTSTNVEDNLSFKTRFKNLLYSDQNNITNHNITIQSIVKTSAILDIYFIFRAYKQDNDEQQLTKKVVMCYFGRAHVKALTHYFTEIVKTSALIAMYDSKEKRIIEITDNIDLNDFVVQSGASRIKRTRKQKRRKSKKTKKNRSNKRKRRRYSVKI